jgi:hypothetical protein
MDEKEREYWFTYWTAGAFATGKMAKLAHCLNLANQLKLNGSSIDIHIQNISPRISGGVTTSAGGHAFFEDLGDLEAILYTHADMLKSSLEKANDAES